jgi:hypothetical protein
MPSSSSLLNADQWYTVSDGNNASLLLCVSPGSLPFAGALQACTRAGLQTEKCRSAQVTDAN